MWLGWFFIDVFGESTLWGNSMGLVFAVFTETEIRDMVGRYFLEFFF